MKNPKDWVRIRDDRTGHHLTVSRRAADNSSHYRILGNSSAVDVNGRPLPPKYLQATPQEVGDVSETTEQP